MSAKAILVGAAPLRSRTARARLKNSLARKSVLRVAVDGGLDVFRSLGLQPDLYVGDLDSVRRIPPQVPAVFLPHEKDYSDLRAAIGICSEMRINHIEAWAVTGGRPDHHWASLEELGSCLVDGRIRRLEAHGDDGSFFAVTPASPLRLNVRRGSILSLFDWHRAGGLTTAGLAYNLKAGRLRTGSHGLSNSARSEVIRVSLKSGIALVIVPHGT